MIVRFTHRYSHPAQFFAEVRLDIIGDNVVKLVNVCVGGITIQGNGQWYRGTRKYPFVVLLLAVGTAWSILARVSTSAYRVAKGENAANMTGSLQKAGAVCRRLDLSNGCSKEEMNGVRRTIFVSIA